ncbi:MAG: FtsQ-type POTRA domain-containing protein [Eubacteriales bacterium]|jgi:hypothetical protein|nr:FtsQ-type POTRA domain-containing protein [Clostridiales bacterium]
MTRNMQEPNSARANLRIKSVAPSAAVWSNKYGNITAKGRVSTVRPASTSLPTKESMRQEDSQHKSLQQKRGQQDVKAESISAKRKERLRHDEKLNRDAEVAEAYIWTRRRRARARLYAIIVICIALIALSSYVIYKGVFVVKSISVELPGDEASQYSELDIIAAAGITEGDGMFSFSSAKIKQAVIRVCPYISDVTIRRKYPDGILISVTEEKAVFYTVISGQYALVSPTFRVLEFIGGDDGVEDAARAAEYVKNAGLIKLKLPRVTEVIAGFPIKLEASENNGEMEDIVLTVLARVAQDDFIDRISVVGATNRFALYMVCDCKYRFELGSVDDLDVKMTLADKMLRDEIFATGNKGTLYLSDVTQPSVIIDNRIDLD